MELVVPCPFADLPLTFVLVEASLGTQLGPSHAHSGPAEPATNCGLLFSSKQVAHSWSQAVPDTDLHQSPSEKAPEPTHPVVGFKLHQSTNQLPSQSAHPKGDLGRQQTLLGQIPLHWVSPPQ